MVLPELHSCSFSRPGVDRTWERPNNRPKMGVSLNILHSIYIRIIIPMSVTQHRPLTVQHCTLGHRSTLHALWRVLVRFGPLPNLEAFFSRVVQVHHPKIMELCEFTKMGIFFTVLLQPMRSKV